MSFEKLNTLEEMREVGVCETACNRGKDNVGESSEKNCLQNILMMDGANITELERFLSFLLSCGKIEYFTFAGPPLRGKWESGSW